MEVWLNTMSSIRPMPRLSASQISSSRSAIAAVVCVATSTTANAIGVGGIPGILSIQPAYMLSFALCMAIAIVVPFVLTVIVGKKKGVA